MTLRDIAALSAERCAGARLAAERTLEELCELVARHRRGRLSAGCPTRPQKPRDTQKDSAASKQIDITAPCRRAEFRVPISDSASYFT